MRLESITKHFFAKSTGMCVDYYGYKNRDGYGVTYYNGKKVLAHRLSYCLSKGISIESISGMVIRHKCDNPACVNPGHLLIGTQAENMKDKVIRGRQSRISLKGEKNGRSKLNAIQVSEIKSRYQPHSKDNGSRALGREFCVDHALIRQIVAGKIWGEVAKL